MRSALKNEIAQDQIRSRRLILALLPGGVTARENVVAQSGGRCEGDSNFA